MGATVVAVDVEEHFGGVKYISGTITMSNSYATDGDTLDLSTYLSEIDHVNLQGRSGYQWGWDKANKKVKSFWNDFDAGSDAALIEVTAATDRLHRCRETVKKEG